MPGGDRTGPMGMGPRTGRSLGFCEGYPEPGYTKPGFGRGFYSRGGVFGGGGRGRRNQYYATGLPGWARYGRGMQAWGISPQIPAGYSTTPGYYGEPLTPVVSEEDRINFLKDQAKYLEESLSEIKRQISEVKSKPKEK